MWQRFVGMSVLFALTLSLSSFGADVDKKKKKGVDAEDPVNADTLKPGEFFGKLLSLPSPSGDFTVEVEVKHLELKNPNQPLNTVPHTNAAYRPNQGNNAAVHNLQKEQQNISRLQTQLQQAKNPKEAAKYLQNLQNALAQFQQQYVQVVQQAEIQVLKAAQAEQQQAQQQLQQLQNMFKVVTTKKVVEFHCGEEIPVRNLTLPMEYDDKGQPKKYTAEETKKLKGKNPNTPGYEAKLEDLKTGSQVRVSLAYLPKPIPPKKDAEKNDAEKKDADKDAEKKDVAKKDVAKKDAADGLVGNKELVHRTTVKLVMIISDDGAVETGSMADKKGKK